jgi:hypothetical protein
MTPADNRHDNAGLEVRRSWTDPNPGASVSVDVRSDTSLTVTVSMP